MLSWKKLRKTFVKKTCSLNVCEIDHRIVIISTCLTGSILIWSYSACLVSFLTIDYVHFHITSLEVSGLSFLSKQIVYKRMLNPIKSRLVDPEIFYC